MLNARFSDHIARLKAWHIFLLLVALPFFVHMQFFMPMLTATSTPGTFNIENFETMFLYSMRFSAVIMSLFLTWLLAVSFAALRRSPEPLRQSTKLVVAGALFSGSYMFLTPHIWPMPSDLQSPEFDGSFMTLVMPLHILATVCMFYALVFAARSLVQAEKQSAVNFGDYAAVFALLWFFPVGIWVVQPRFNRIAKDRG